MTHLSVPLTYATLRRAVTSISIFIRGSAKPATSIVLAGRISPKYSRSTGQHAGQS